MLDNIRTILKPIGIPIGYISITSIMDSIINYPYFVLKNADDVSGSDDMTVTMNNQDISIELYQDEYKLDTELIEKTVKALTNAGFEVDYETIWIDSERLWETVFNINQIIK